MIACDCDSDPPPWFSSLRLLWFWIQHDHSVHTSLRGGNPALELREITRDVRARATRGPSHSLLASFCRSSVGEEAAGEREGEGWRTPRGAGRRAGRDEGEHGCLSLARPRILLLEPPGWVLCQSPTFSSAPHSNPMTRDPERESERRRRPGVGLSSWWSLCAAARRADLRPFSVPRVLPGRAALCFRSTCGGRCPGRPRRTRTWRSTWTGRWRGRRGWSLRSRRSTCARAGR